MTALAPTHVHIDAERIDALLHASHPAHRPGIAVGVAHRGRPVLTRGYGLFDALHSDAPPKALTPATPMRIGSVTKHFCALAVMLLAEEGRLDPSDSVRRHLPELPPWAEPITLTQLMSHTSGMRCHVDLLFFTSGAQGLAVPDALPYELLRGQGGVNFAAGSDFSYCNGGYLLLSMVVDRLAGVPLEQFLQTRVLQPLGMRNSFLQARDLAGPGRTATLHVVTPDGGYRQGDFGIPIRGEGGLVSSVDDMLLWMAHLSLPRIGRAATWHAMRTPVALNNGASTGYGLGLMSGEYRGQRVMHHSGGVVGGSSQMINLVDHALDVVVISNTTEVDAVAVAARIVDLCVTGLPPEPAAQVAAFTGAAYDSSNGRFVRLLNHEGRATIEVQGVKFPALLQNDGAWWARTNVATGLSLRPATEPGGLTCQDVSGLRVLQPLQPPKRGDLDGMQGLYRCDDAGFSATLEVDGDATLRLQGCAGTITYRLQPLADGLWKGEHGISTLPARPVIERCGAGLLFSTLRSRRLLLRRV